MASFKETINSILNVEAELETLKGAKTLKELSTLTKEALSRINNKCAKIENLAKGWADCALQSEVDKTLKELNEYACTRICTAKNDLKTPIAIGEVAALFKAPNEL